MGQKAPRASRGYHDWLGILLGRSVHGRDGADALVSAAAASGATPKSRSSKGRSVQNAVCSLAV